MMFHIIEMETNILILALAALASTTILSIFSMWFLLRLIEFKAKKEESVEKFVRSRQGE